MIIPYEVLNQISIEKKSVRRLLVSLRANQPKRSGSKRSEEPLSFPTIENQRSINAIIYVFLFTPRKYRVGDNADVSVFLIAWISLSDIQFKVITQFK